METIEFLAIPLAEYFDGKLTIEDILKIYEDHGFDANQDWPGNVRWEELYDASPKGTKVILTVRDHEEVWYRKALLNILGFNLIKDNSSIKIVSLDGINLDQVLDLSSFLKTHFKEA